MEYKLLSQFLIELSRDPAKLAEYAQNPEAMLASEGLHPDHQLALKNNDLQAVREHLNNENLGDLVAAVFWVC